MSISKLYFLIECKEQYPYNITSQQVGSESVTVKVACERERKVCTIHFLSLLQTSQLILHYITFLDINCLSVDCFVFALTLYIFICANHSNLF